MRKHSVKFRCLHHDHMVEALATDGADDAFHVGILPWRSWCRANALDVEGCDRGRHIREHSVAVMQQIRRRGVLRKGVASLLGGPRPLDAR
jgi:hypothetical protein